MRWLACLSCALVLGCSEQPTGRGEIPLGKRRSIRAAPQPQSEPEDPAPVALTSVTPTRQAGSHRPRFLGPLGTSVSTETGIISPWPKEGLRIVWHKKLGTGYGMPSISKGRLFQFDRHGDRARLTCMNSETGAFLWKFDYPTDYEDYYGYNNGPRCSPLIDGDRVYLYGAEGIIHCVRVEDGKPVWKVDTKTQFGVVQNFFGVGS